MHQVHILSSPHNGDETLNIIEASAEYDVCF